MWDLWWTKWHWDRFFLEFFGFPLSVSFHRCSITRKRIKNNNIIIIFITGLRKKPQGCGASVASAAGPFTTKKTVSFRNFAYAPKNEIQCQKFKKKVDTGSQNLRFVIMFNY
jgi:hypothetical protein